MREPLKDRVRLEHIEEAANNIARFTAGKTYDDMSVNDMMCYPVRPDSRGNRSTLKKLM